MKVHFSEMHTVDSFKVADVQQKETNNIFRNAKLKLLKTTRRCGLTKYVQQTTEYVQLKVHGNSQQSINTKLAATKTEAKPINPIRKQEEESNQWKIVFCFLHGVRAEFTDDVSFTAVAQQRFSKLRR